MLCAKNSNAWCSGDALGSYSGDAGFESRPGHRISRLRFFAVFLQSLQINAGIVSGLDHACFVYDPTIQSSQFREATKERLQGQCVERDNIEKMGDKSKHERRIGMCGGVKVFRGL
jgi:hypothetical protein